MRTSRPTLPGLAFVCAVAALTAASARAQTPDTTAKPATSGSKPLGFLTDTVQRYGLVPHRLTLAVGGFLPSVSSSGHLSSPSVPGSDINLENALGLKSNLQSIDLQAALRIKNKSLLTIGYFALKRDATRSLSDSIVFGGDTYHAGANIDASSKLAYYGLTYRYYIWRKERWELGAGLGIDALDISAALAIRVTAGSGFADSASKSGGFTAPAPMLGLYGDWEFQPRFYLRGQLQYLYINNVVSYGGHVSDDRLAVEWFPLHNYGLGLMYHYIDLGITKQFANGGEVELKYTVQGPAFYLTAAF